MRFPDPDPDPGVNIISFWLDLKSLSKVEIKFEEGNNFIRIFMTPSAGNQLAGKVPEGKLVKALLLAPINTTMDIFRLSIHLEQA